MAIQYSSSRILSRGGQRMGLRSFSISQKQPGASGIVVLTTDAPFNWNLELIKLDSTTDKPRRRILKPLRRSAKGLIYVRLPRLPAGQYTLAAKPVDVEESWIRLYVTDGLPPSPDQDVGHRIDSLGAAAAGMVELSLADLEYLIGDTPITESGENKAAFVGGADECFINHTPGCTSSSTEDGDMPDNPGDECTGGLGQEGDNACAGSGIYSQHESEPCAGGFDLACGITTKHNVTPVCDDGTAFDVPLCVFGHEEEPCGAPHVPDPDPPEICPSPALEAMPDPICTTEGHKPPCGSLLGQPIYFAFPSSSGNDSDPSYCNLAHPLLDRTPVGDSGSRTGFARRDLSDYIFALLGSRIEHRSVPAKSMTRLAEAIGWSVRDLRLAIDLLNAAADVSLAMFDEVQGRLQSEAGGE